MANLLHSVFSPLFLYVDATILYPVQALFKEREHADLKPHSRPHFSLLRHMRMQHLMCSPERCECRDTASYRREFLDSLSKPTEIIIQEQDNPSLPPHIDVDGDDLHWEPTIH